MQRRRRSPDWPLLIGAAKVSGELKLPLLRNAAKVGCCARETDGRVPVPRVVRVMPDPVAQHLDRVKDCGACVAFFQLRSDVFVRHSALLAFDGWTMFN